MIGFLRGELVYKGDGYILIDVGGVGYQVIVPSNTSAYLRGEGQEVTVYTVMIVREDDISLFGFSGRTEQEAFTKLISVSGVGPKVAVAILSAFTMDQLQQAIVFEDSKTLQKANGVGRKTAERIVLELKDKFSAEGIRDPYGTYAGITEQVAGREGQTVQNNRGEAVNALVALGYTRSEAVSALAGIEEQDLTVEEYIKRALKDM
ncbi:MAG: Holliday junction branch migration protein RuvA [Lentihominibacter sp.]|jgi:Holliday junction DNA helicase RuvA